MCAYADMKDEFVRKAEVVSARTSTTSTRRKALEYALDLCPQGGTLAAPGLNKKERNTLEKECSAKGVTLLADNLRNYLKDHPEGFSVGFTPANWGVAESGTLVVYSENEDVRLATMLSEKHVATVPLKKLVPSMVDMERTLERRMASASGYTAFITGPSRTADIERVLTLGVHGPLELHILVLDESQETSGKGGDR